MLTPRTNQCVNEVELTSLIKGPVLTRGTNPINEHVLEKGNTSIHPFNHTSNHPSIHPSIHPIKDVMQECLNAKKSSYLFFNSCFQDKIIIKLNKNYTKCITSYNIYTRYKLDTQLLTIFNNQ